jgi:hypothetical protein
VQVDAMGLAVIAEAPQHRSVQLPDRRRQLLGEGGDRLGRAGGLLGLHNSVGFEGVST